MKLCKSITSAIIICALINAACFAQALLNLTVEECVEIGLKNSRSLHSSAMNVDFTAAKLKEACAARLPALKFGGSYTRLSEVDPFTISVPLPPPSPSEFTISPSIMDSYNLMLTLQQPIFTGFGLSNASKIAEFNSKASQSDFNRDKAELIYSIKTAYWNLHKAIEYRVVVAENVKMMESHLTDIQNFYDQGMVTNDELLKVQVQLSNSRLLLLQAEDAVQMSKLNLNNIMGLSLSSKINLASEIDPDFSDYDKFKSLVERAMENRPEIEAMGYRVKAGEAGVKLAKSPFYPQVFLIGNYYYARPNPRIFPSEDEFEDTWDVGVGVSFDLWNWRKTFHQKDQAQASLYQVRDALKLLEDAVVLEVTQNHLALSQAKERIAVARINVSQAEESHRITLEKFRNGVATNTALLDAEVALLTAKINLTNALIDFELARASLDKSIGL
ncbi:MAG: TolC family protein [candidate division Zixibacteria bacterium]|nr:TolC family protein [Candidatus Tariuqbacter arcticus]